MVDRPSRPSTPPALWKDVGRTDKTDVAHRPPPAASRSDVTNTGRSTEFSARTRPSSTLESKTVNTDRADDTDTKPNSNLYENKVAKMRRMGMSEKDLQRYTELAKTGTSLMLDATKLPKGDPRIPLYYGIAGQCVAERKKMSKAQEQRYAETLKATEVSRSGRTNSTKGGTASSAGSSQGGRTWGSTILRGTAYTAGAAALGGGAYCLYTGTNPLDYVDPSYVDTAKSGVSYVAEGTSNIVSSAYSGLSSGAGYVASGVYTGVSSLASGAGSLLSGAGSFLSGWTGGAATAAATSAVSAATSAVPAYPEFPAAATSALDAMPAPTDVRSVSPGLMGSIVSAVTFAPSAAYAGWRKWTGRNDGT